MKVIFLDIDGVLAIDYRHDDDYGSRFDINCVNNLRKIIYATNAKIVCSSSWRKGGSKFPELNGLEFIKSLWKKRDLPSEIIDVTSTLRLQKGGCIGFYNNKLKQHPTPEIKGYSIPRGCEIEYWLDNEGQFQRVNWSKNEQQKYIDKAVVKNYVILDDDSDMLYNQREHFVHCKSGLTNEVADKAIQILNSSLIELYY